MLNKFQVIENLLQKIANANDNVDQLICQLE